MILLPIFGGIKSKPVKAEKAALSVSSYDELLSFLFSSLSQKGGFAIAKYKQLRREFIDIMNLQNIEK